MVALALAAFALGGPPSTAGASLHVTARAPLTLQGRGFGRVESIRVTVTGSGRSTVRTIRSSATGTFTVAVPGYALDGASDLDVAAVGSRGHRASFSVRHTTGGAVSKI